ncbi:MAG: M81 family metallopeptidase [Caldilineaceae bacterium]|jgi:microcystin degradation protein MlrC|nr:M81 family metallopeptidase [Caldilineaceae bacterium]
MRIALGGIAIESCTFSPLPSRLDDFTVRRGADFLDRYPFLADFAGRAEFVPLLYARALPGGSVEPDAYAALKAEYLDLLRANGPWDGVYLDFHGAMHVRGMDDAEGDWVTAVREVVGPACLLAASFDLHGNISEREAATLDMLTAFRTAPHVDYMETRAKALRMLLDCLDQQLRPARVWIPIPVVLPGEKTSTEWAPGDRLYAALTESDGAPGLLDISLLVGYVWADEPRTSATVIATGLDRNVLAREAQKVAQRYWDARHEFQFGVPAGTIDECIAWGLDAPESCVFISDSGDNPTAGGAGDTTVALAALIKHGAPAVVASIADAPAIQTMLAAGVGASVAVELGGKLDPITCQPLAVHGIVRHLARSENTEAVLQVGDVHVIVTERRRPYHFVADMQRLGLEPLAHKLVVIKIGYLEPDLKRHAPRALLALTPGAVDQAIERLPFQRVRRPLFPLDPTMAWTPMDAAL